VRLEVDPPGGGADTSPAESYRVRAGGFEGPLDLLLHLVRANEVDLFDIPIVAITEQYQEHLERMREMNLTIAGDYLVMAATLVHIKSRMLLPVDPAAEEGDEADPRAGLIQELLEYQRFKQAAETLHALDSRQNLIWTRDEVARDFRDEETLAVDLIDLVHAFRQLLGRLGEEARIHIRRDQVSVAEKITWLGELLEERQSVDLLALLEDLPTRLDRIATFLAVLEMLRLGWIAAFQRKPAGEIRIRRLDDGRRTAEIGT
jgi:segregation and condensation protein A